MKRKDITVLLVSNKHKKEETEFLSSLGYRVLPTVCNGIDALSSISANKPQVILSEVFLPQLDFCGMLDELREYHGVLIGISSCPNDKLAARLMNKGADYFFIRPCESVYLTRVIDDFVEEKLVRHHIPPNPEIRNKFLVEDNVIEMLDYLGIPTNLLGYNYIRKSILLALEDENILKSITTGLYCVVAELFQTKPKSVERAMRTAIGTAWARGDLEAQLAVFGYTISDDKGKPTNSEFVTKVVDKLRLKLANQ